MATVATAPIQESRINSTVYVGGAGVRTIQAAVNYAVKNGGSFMVVIPYGYAGSDTIGGVINGSATVLISDQRGDSPQSYAWEGTAYIAADFMQLGNIYAPYFGVVRGQYFIADNGASQMQDGATLMDFQTPDNEGRLIAKSATAALASLSLGGASNTADGRVMEYLRFSEFGGPGSALGEFFVPLNVDGAITSSGQMKARGWNPLDVSESYTAIGVGNDPTTPILTLTNAASPTDQRVWIMAALRDRLIFSAETDGGEDDIWMQIIRSAPGVLSAVDIYPPLNCEGLTATDAEFNTCEVNGSPVRTFANTPSGSMVYPGAGLALSTGAAWGASLDPATLQGKLTLTTTGSSGAATLTGNTLNIPNYAGGGGSMVYPDRGIAVSNDDSWSDSIPTTDIAYVGKTNNFTTPQQFSGAVGGLLTIISDPRSGGLPVLTIGQRNPDGPPVYNITGDGGSVYVNTPVGGQHVCLNWDAGLGVRFGDGNGGQAAILDNTGVLTLGPLGHMQIAPASNGYTSMTFNGNNTDGGRMGLVGGPDFNVLFFDMPVDGGYWFRINNIQVAQIRSDGVIQAQGFAQRNFFVDTQGNVTTGTLTVQPQLAVERPAPTTQKRGTTKPGTKPGSDDDRAVSNPVTLTLSDDGASSFIDGGHGILRLNYNNTPATATTQIGGSFAILDSTLSTATTSIDNTGKATFNGSVTAATITMGAGQFSDSINGSGNLRLNAATGGGVLINGDANTGNLCRWGAGDGATIVASIDGSGNAHFNGTLSAGGAKTFAVPHPTDEGKNLVHACLEGPENGVFYRGEVTTANGMAEVTLPDYFDALTFTDDRSILLTQVFEGDLQEFALLAATRVVGGKFRIRATVPRATVAWEVKAVRRIGVDRLNVVSDHVSN